MAFDVAGALAAGYSPDEVLDHLASQGPEATGGFDVQGALKAGYKPAEITSFLTQPKPPEPTFWNQLGPRLAQGVAAPLQQMGVTADLLGAPGTGQALQSAGAAIAPGPGYVSPTEKLAEHPWDNLGYLPGAAVEQVGNVVGDLASRAAGGAAGAALGSVAGPGGAAVGGAVGAFSGPALFQAATALGPTALARARNDGRDTPNADDWKAAALAAGVQGALAGTLAKYLPGSKEAGEAISKMAMGGASNVAGQFAGNVVQQAAETAATQKGLEVDPKAAFGQALAGATAASGVSGLSSAARMGAAALADHKTTQRAGENLRAYADETSAWDDAVQQAQERIKSANPQVDPEQAREQAYTEAQKAGATPPSFENLTPRAQVGLAEMTALQYYQMRRATEERGQTPEAMANHTPGRTFKGVLDDVSRNLTDLSDAMVRAGTISKDDVAPLKDAISEARRHNRQAGEGGEDVGYFDTLRDKVAALPVDAAIRNHLMLNLRVLDIATANSLESRSRGPLETLAKTLPVSGALAGAAGFLTGGAGAIPAIFGSLGGLAAKGMLVGHARTLDKNLGFGLPDILRRQGAIDAFANREGLSTVTDPMALMALVKEQRDLAASAPVQRAKAQADTKGPVTARPGAPQAAPEAPPGQPVIQPDTGPVAPPGAPTPASQMPTVQPVAQPVMPTSAPQALATMRAAMEARAGQMDAAAQAAFPDRHGPWASGIADALGVRAADVTRIANDLAARPDMDPQLAGALKDRHGNLPQAAFYGLSDHIRNLRDAGELQMVGRGEPRPNATQTSTIHNPASYEASIRQAEAAANAVRGEHPTGVAEIEAESHVQDKRAALDLYLETLPPAQRASAEALLKPLTEFGDKKPRGGGAGPSREGRGQGGQPGLGTDPTRRNRGNLSGPQVLSDARFKRGEKGPGERPLSGGLKPGVPLEGLPKEALGPHEPARIAAEDYAKKAGINYEPARTYGKVNVERAKRIADEYERMPNDPQNPEVKAAYAAMIQETLGQYQSMLDHGFRISDLHDEKTDPYRVPRDAIKDVRENNRMSVFGTEAGYGSKGITAEDRAANPLLAPTKFKTESGKPLLANDIFRAVHDYFGHNKEGVGFRAAGEENAWRSHAAMYSPEARRAMTTETRGQNSWLNYGPHGEKNRNAQTADTVFADQKIGLMPEWVSREGAGDEAPVGHNGGPALEMPRHPAEVARVEAEAKAKAAQDRAKELLTEKRFQPTKKEAGATLHSDIDALARGEGAKKRGQNGVTFAEKTLLPRRAKAGLDPIDWRKPGAEKQVGDLLVKEALYHIAGSDNALGWYEGKLGTAMNMLSRQYPEIKSDPRASAAFKAILAITSNGQPVVKNFEITEKLYSGLRNKIMDGYYHLPTNIKEGGKTKNNMIAAFKAWNTLVDRVGIDDTIKFLGEKHKVADLEKMMPGLSISGESKKALVYGASVLGPKIGNGFFSNLNGRFDMPTMDRWFITTISRLTGGLVKRDTAAQSGEKANRVGEALAGFDKAPDLHRFVDHEDVTAARLGDPEALDRVAAGIMKADDKQGFPRVDNGKLVDGKAVSPESDELRKANKAYFLGKEGQRAIMPEGAKHREWLRSVVDHAVKRLNDLGIPINKADFQALIWFPEQRLWQQRFGVGGAKTDANYEDAAVIHLLRNGGEHHVSREYSDQGYSPEQVRSMIDARRKLAEKLDKEPTNGEDDEASE